MNLKEVGQNELKSGDKITFDDGNREINVNSNRDLTDVGGKPYFFATVDLMRDDFEIVRATPKVLTSTELVENSEPGPGGKHLLAIAAHKNGRLEMHLEYKEKIEIIKSCIKNIGSHHTPISLKEAIESLPKP